MSSSNKKDAQTYQIRYRPQTDPLIHDQTAPDFVFTAVEAPNASKAVAKAKTKNDLEEEFDISSVRPNEGEAANYGVYYDDSKYDYMQHLRNLGDGDGSGQAVFIEAKQPKEKSKKMSFEDMLNEEIEKEEKEKAKISLPKELLASEVQIKRTYQDQQAVPDALAGFQPDMDPRLREVLEALEDDAYVDDDEDIFGELAQGGEATEEDFEDMYFDEEDEDGYASDATEKPSQPQVRFADENKGEKGEVGEEEGANDDWMKEFSKFKKTQKKSKQADDLSSMAETMSFGGLSSVGSTMSVSKRRRRREKKSGTTESSGYSMSSSALFRTEGLTLLDDRFDRVRSSEFLIETRTDNSAD